MMLTKPRYEPRVLPIVKRRGRLIYAIFDTFAQEFARETPLTKREALHSTKIMNQEYDTD